ncbi:MAG: fumarylacetoacetate hydrolase family protein [Clostridia bacterium]|nr:fumarylacetoacetate hydrolase family protein [Clostridia bacterium]MCL6521931.1 fumarylacetoacetate hydrolase family protein [Bacillota bacterium]
MRLGLLERRDGSQAVCAWTEAGVVDLELARERLGAPPDAATRSLAAAVEDADAVERLARLAQAGRAWAEPPAEVRWLPPLVRPDRPVFCVGKNYAEHVREGARAGEGSALPAAPMFFTKLAATVVGNGRPVVAWSHTRELDYEAELGVVLGRDGRDVGEDEVPARIFGYTLVNDVTARDLQRLHGQWFKGKNLETFCPVGPWIVTADEVGWPVELELTLRVNGEIRQRLHTREMIFDIARIVADLSRGLTLRAGDLISTGTGPGCAFGMAEPRWLRPGDRVEVECGAIGTLWNEIVGDAGR